MTTTDKLRPTLAYAVATGLGLGYLPIAPGTWGSLGGAALYVLMVWGWGVARLGRPLDDLSKFSIVSPEFLTIHLGVIVIISVAGVWASTQVERHLGMKDPGLVVIDEIAGQQIAYFGLPFLDWKYLLAGFLLFRAFDIWKPFPARQVEPWSEGWGVMADDWIVGVYAALVLFVARHYGWLGA